MKPYSHILVPIDFSEPSRRALDYGLGMARALEAKLTLLHVVARPLPLGPTGLIPVVEDEARHAEDAKAELEKLIPAAERRQASVETVTGEIEDEILAAVDRLSVDLVVMGSHGRRRFARWFLGSVTERILRQIPASVMTVSHPAESGPASGPIEIRRILYPTDFSDSSEIALPTAVELARRFGAELHLVHVTERLKRSPTSPPWSDEEMAREQKALDDRARDRLGKIAADAGTSGLAVQQTVLEGKPSESVIDHAGRSGADLIVMSLHGMSFVERALLGATAEQIVRGSPVPVLSVPRT